MHRINAIREEYTHEKQKQDCHGGGAKASKKLMAAMAVLAVAFVVLAAVPVALTDSDATTSQNVEKVISTETTTGLEVGKWYFVTADSKIGGVTGTINLIVEKNVTVTFADATTKANIYIGTCADETASPIVCEYDADTLIQVTGVASGTVKVNNDETKTYALASSQTFDYGVEAVIDSAAAVVHSPLATTGYTFAQDADYVHIKIPSSMTDGKYAAKFDITDTESSKVALNVRAGNSGVNLKFTQDGTNDLQIETTAKTFEGTVTVSAGTLAYEAVASTPLKGIVGIGVGDTSTTKTMYKTISTASATMTATENNVISLPQGFTTTTSFTINVGGGAGSPYVAINASSDNPFTVNQMGTETKGLVFTVGSSNDLTLSGDTAQVNNKSTANWTGELEIKDTTNLKLGTVNLGSLKTGGYIATGSMDVFGTLTLTGNLTLTGVLTLGNGASVDAGQNKIVDPSTYYNIVIKAGATASFTITNASSSGKDLILAGVTSGTSDLTIIPDAAAYTLSGAIGSGTITAGTGAASSTVAITTLAVNGQTSGQKLVINAESSVSGTMTISPGNTVELQKAMSVTGKLNVMGSISGSTITVTSPGTINTPTGEAGDYVKSTLGDNTKVNTTRLSVGVGTFAQLKAAVDAGILDITMDEAVAYLDGTTITPGLITIGKINGFTGTNFEIPEGVTFTLGNGGTENIKVAKGYTLTVKGTILANGATSSSASSANNSITLEAKDASTAAGSLRNEGTIIIGAITAGQGARIVNSGTISLGAVSTLGKNVMVENSGKLNLYADLTIGDSEAASTEGAEFDNSGSIQIATTKKITVNENSVLINSGKIDSVDRTVVIEGDGTFQNRNDGSVGVKVQTLYIEGITESVRVEQSFTSPNTYLGIQILEIPEGANLKITSTTKITVQGKMIIDGTLTIEGKLTIASVYGAKAAELILNGDIIIAEGGQLVIGGYEDGIKLVSEGDKGTGKLTVNSGASIVAQNGGRFTVTSGSASIAGSLTMDEGSYLAVDGDAPDVTPKKAAGTLSISGSADLNGYLDGTMAISNSGIVSIDNSGNTARTDLANKTDVTVKMTADGAIFNLDSLLMEKTAGNAWTALTVTDAGLVTYYNADGSVNSSISATNNDQVVITLDEDDDRTVKMTKAYVSGSLVIEQSASYKNVTGQSVKSQTYGMDISGSVVGAFTYASSIDNPADAITMEITSAGTVKYADTSSAKVKDKGGVSVTDQLTIGNAVKTTLKSQAASQTYGSAGVLSVSGFIINNVAGSVQMTADTGSNVAVSGQIVSSNAIAGRGVVNAVYYYTTITSGSVKTTTHYYTTLDEAIEGVQVEGNTAAKTLTIVGYVYLTEDATIPAAIKVQFADSSAHLYVGSSTARITLTSEAQIDASKQIDVAGTLTFPDKTKDRTSGTVSDVMYESENKTGYRTYTNIYSAIEEAGESSDAMTIEVTKKPENGAVELTQNLVIPSNVTLVVGNDLHVAGLELMDGVTLTVDGTLKTSQDITAEKRFAINAMDVSENKYYSSAIVVNGELMIADTMDVTPGNGIAVDETNATSLIASAPIFGAYYDIQNWHVFSNIDDALAETKITSSAIAVYGPAVGSDATVTANDTFAGVVVDNSVAFYPVGTQSGTRTYTTLTMNSLTLGKGTGIDMTGAFTGAVKVGENAVDFAKITGIIAYNVDDALLLTGSVNMNDKDMSLVVSAGTVSLGGKVNSVDTSFTQTSSSDTKYAMKIASGATATVAYSSVSVAKLNVAGTLEVPANKILSIENQLDVSGTVKIAEATASASGGSLVINKASSSSYAKAYVGISSSDYYSSTITLGAAASVTGPVTLYGEMFVASGATVDTIDSDWKSTAVYNGGSLWFTAYASDGCDKALKLNKAPMTNAVLAGWSKTEGGDVIRDSSDKVQMSFTIGSTGQTKLYSVVKTDIYTIVIKADTGIGDLYLNGNIMQKGTIVENGMFYSAFRATVSYGTYEVTCKLANGYSGTAVLKDSTGATVSANKFTTPEATDYKEVDFQLTGIEKSGYVQPTEEKDNSGLTVTDYLLIVLVILVVILAVIVALRLMRS